jgi:hypothetical protein
MTATTTTTTTFSSLFSAERDGGYEANAHHDALPWMILRRQCDGSYVRVMMRREYQVLFPFSHRIRCRARTSFNMTWFGRWCGELSNAPVEAMRDIRSGLYPR